MLAGCASASTTATQLPGSVTVSHTTQAPAPAAGAVTRTTIYETPRSVIQILRLSAGAEIAEHHHPFYDENFIVEQGTVTAVLNGTTHVLQAGAVVVIPAGTVIRGRNTGE